MDTKHLGQCINHLSLGVVRKINMGILVIGSLGFSSKILTYYFENLILVHKVFKRQCFLL